PSPENDELPFRPPRPSELRPPRWGFFPRLLPFRPPLFLSSVSVVGALSCDCDLAISAARIDE
ncbi:hypothetical protein A2U01_0069751, partial [Trifolium medium]|nr:hypothetical protein [Trifolium medium]